MFEDLPARVDADPWLVRRGQHLTGTIRVGVGPDGWLLDIVAGRVTGVRAEADVVMPAWRFEVSAPAEEWAMLREPHPAPGHHDLMALRRRRALHVGGDVLAFMTHLQYVKDILTVPQATEAER